MKRRTFFKTTALAAPALVLSCKGADKIDENTEDPLLEKVITAMLTMQRASWEHGVAAQALLESGRKDLAILMAKEAVLRQLEDGRLSVLYTDNGVTDSAASGTAVLFAANELNDEKMKYAADQMLKSLQNTSHKTTDGILHHTLDKPEIWIDSMYMATPFLADMGEYDEAVKQIVGFRNALWNQNMKLYSHRWDTVNEIFINEKFWGVGNGWALAGITRVINILPESHDADKDRLIAYVKEHLSSILDHMRSDGLYHDIVDDPDSFVETNLGQMIAYTIYTGVKSGWLDKNLIPKAKQIRSAARSKVDEYGYVQGVCGAPYFNNSGRATEGQAFFILMEAARTKYRVFFL
jgi:rhamnogalacturonyl hydrolase YesR